MTDAAAKQRRYRRRRRDGMIAITVSIDQVSAVETLIRLGLLNPRDYDCKRAIAEALDRAEARLIIPGEESVTR